MHVLSMVKQHGGKDLSFNNLLDLNAARLLVAEFKVPAAAIIKHNNPCGVASASRRRRLPRAFACDPLSAFGGVDLPQPAGDRELAEAIVEQFAELVFAPGFDDDALEILAAKPNMRILEDDERRTLNVVRAGHQARHRRPARPGPRHAT
jgi:phosphoribosylaminoimidazolecarboxamide formyltransferase/IMP cyclohydrolase